MATSERMGDGAPNESGRKVGHTEGPWGVSEWSGGEGYRAGFYVSRLYHGRAVRRVEWMQNANGRARRFPTREAAEAAIAKATGAQS